MGYHAAVVQMVHPVSVWIVVHMHSLCRMAPVWHLIGDVIMYERIVTTKYGKIEGFPEYNPVITSYKGVPYAKPPVGALRWRGPQELEPWEGIIKADTFGGTPPQVDSPFAPVETRAVERKYTEDVLRLNIWTPAKENDAKLSVFVWFHGGAYQTGGASGSVFYGERLAEKGILVVTVGYRLGVLGYLCHPDSEQESAHGKAGNFGLQDQAFALKWIHENIAAFGGDSDKVTIGGQSAGAESVCNMIASPLAKGLFRGAICQSGDGFMNISGADNSYEAALSRGKKFSEELGDGTLESLRQLPYEAFVHGQCDEYAEKTGACCVPVEDGVILKNMNQILLNEPDVNVPMIVGNNRDEGLPAASMEVKLAGYEEKDRRYIEGFYVAGKQDDIESMKKQAVALSNEEWYARVIYWARIRERVLGMPTWQYQFCRSAEINGFPIGAVHSSELSFVFETYYKFDAFDVKDGDPAIACIMATYWSNFVKNLDPNGAGVPHWIRKGEDAGKHLYIDEKIEMTDDVYDERVNAELRLMERIYGIKILD